MCGEMPVKVRNAPYRPLGLPEHLFEFSATLRFPQKKHPQDAPIPEADLSAPQSNFSTPSEALLPQERPR